VNENIPSADQPERSLKRPGREGLDEEELQDEVQGEEQLEFYEGKIN
jgi:hypothetical protein